MRENKFFQKIVGYVIVVGAIALIIGLILYFQSSHHNFSQKGKYAEDIKENVLYKVAKVLDGDTVVTNVSGHEVTIRMIGIDTPEVVDPRKPVQCYGPEASTEAKELLSGKEIYLEKESAKGKENRSYDIYGRVLAYAHFADGNLYNEFMIKNGFAKEYAFNKEKYKYQKEFKDLQKEAQKSKVGLWGKCEIK